MPLLKRILLVLVASMLAATLGMTPARTALAQDDAAKSQDDTTKPKEKKPPKPEELDLETRDGVQLKATYYGSTVGKKAVPVLILHDFKGNRTEYNQLALYLQQLGHAVIVPDLRGHGDSTLQRTPINPTPKQLDADKMSKNDFLPILVPGGDLSTIRRVLLQKNNDSELNLASWCVIGVGGFGSVMAMNWAMVDWSYPPLTTGKQGQDVKAIVLISPEQNFKGMTLQLPLNHRLVRSQISTLIMVGREKSSSLRDAERIHATLERYHPVFDKDSSKEEIADKKDLFLVTCDTSLQGAKLLGARSVKPEPSATIAQFIKLRLSDKSIPWEER